MSTRVKSRSRKKSTDTHTTPSLSNKHINAISDNTAVQPNNIKIQHLYVDTHTKQLRENITANNTPYTYKQLSLNTVKQFVYDVFLPVNYPHSVTSDYLQYQIYDTLQGLCSYLRGLLCTQSVLIGIGVGNSSKTISNATINWLYRDGVGMLGSLLFGYFNSVVFAVNAKQYRLFADIANDVGLTLDLLSGIVSDELFVYVICAGTLCRSLCGVAGGATRAALVQHFALENNHSDLATKEGMQETFVSVVGLCMGLYIAQLIDGDNRILYSWIIFVVLTIVHVIANVWAMQGIVFNTLNKQRALILLQHYIQHGTVLTPTQVAARESVFGLYRDKYKLGCAVQRNQLTDLQCKQFTESTLYYCHLINNKYNIYLNTDCSPIEQLYALYEAIQISLYDKPAANTRGLWGRFVHNATAVGWLLDANSIQLNADAYRYTLHSDKVS